MAKKLTLEEEINAFLEMWDCESMTSFLRDILPLFELYDYTDENDWVRDAVGESNETIVRLVRTVYLVSRIAEFHAGKLCNIRYSFKGLYARMEKQGMVKSE